MSKPHLLYPSAREMSKLARQASATDVTRTSAALEWPGGSGYLMLDGTTAREITLPAPAQGDHLVIVAVGETASGAFTVVPKTAGTIKQLDGSTAAATTSLADAGDWVELVCSTEGVWQIVRHNGCTFA